MVMVNDEEEERREEDRKPAPTRYSLLAPRTLDASQHRPDTESASRRFHSCGLAIGGIGVVVDGRVFSNLLRSVRFNLCGLPAAYCRNGS